MGTDNSEPAFPVGANEYGGHGTCFGMTLRDYFAGQFMAGRAAVPGTADHQWDAIQAYEAADAMLAARSA
jgi:ribonuclease I